MKWVDSIIIAFYTLTLLALGIFLVGVALEFFTTDTLIGWLETISLDEMARWQTVALGALCIFASVTTLKMLQQRARRQRHIVYKNESGQIQVSIHAIEEMVRDIGKEFLDIKSLRPSVRIRKQHITVKARLALYSGTQLNILAGRLQDRIKNQLETLLGEDIKISAVVVVRHVDRKGLKRSRPGGADRSMEFGSSVSHNIQDKI